MAGQCRDEQHLDDLIERRIIEGSSLKLVVMQKVAELVVNKRMSQGKTVKDTKEKKKVSGWSIEEMNERPNIAVEEDTEEMKRSSTLNQSEMDLCWKLKGWKRKSWTRTKSKRASTESKRAREGPSKAEETPWNGKEFAETRDIKLESGADDWRVRNFSLFREYNLQRVQSKQEESTEEEEMKQQQRMAIF